MKKLFRHSVINPNNNKNSEKKEPEVTQYVNQWRFRSVRTEVRNLEFYFNEGNTTGNEMLRQFLHVVMCLSMIDIHVAGVLLDAAGNNRRFVRCLLNGENKVVDGWIVRCSCDNVFLGSPHQIYAWFCSTHNLKSLRNQLLSSDGTTKASRIFHDVNSVYFGWSAIKDQWNREVNRLERRQAAQTKLSMSAVYPDSWNKMRVTHAKAIFCNKTLTEDTYHYSHILGCTKEVIDARLSASEKSEGACLVTKRASILQHRAIHIQSTDMSTKSAIASLLFRCCGCALYNQTLMKNCMKRTRANAEFMEVRLRYVLRFFYLV